jgi:putative Mg2+ transporter-C (MgtC) family protein
MILFILSALPFFQKKIDYYNQSKTFYIKSPVSANGIMLCEDMMTAHKLKFRMIKRVKDGDYMLLTWQLHGPSVKMDLFINSISDIPVIEHFEFS